MNRIAFLICAACCLGLLTPTVLRAQRVCGTSLKHQKMQAERPEAYKQLQERSRKAIAEALSINPGETANKTTVQSAIPVVFHFILTPTQLSAIGNDTGIRRRVFSQLKTLNEDFNRKNADSSLIPAAFKGLYGNANIQFGLANTSNSNTILPGVELKVVSSGGTPVYDANVDCYNAKNAGPVGLAAWDVTQYLNIWVVNITAGGAGIVVGITAAPSSVGDNVGGHTITANEIGVVLNYGAIGTKEFATQYFIPGIEKGRTLTHELGHFFELWHTWGDDFGACTVRSGGEDDDYIADTPPQGDAQYCTSGVCPTFPKTDNCSPSFPGIMFMNFMDYVDDRAMQMFTVQQAQVMQFYLNSQSLSLTQNPQLLLELGVAEVHADAVRLYPNPATALVHVALTGTEKLRSIDVVNILGQCIHHITADNSRTYELPLATAPRGIYFVQCHFAEGTLTKKIVLE